MKLGSCFGVRAGVLLAQDTKKAKVSAVSLLYDLVRSSSTKFREDI
jgi:hypothetical protein